MIRRLTIRRHPLSASYGFTLRHITVYSTDATDQNDESVHDHWMKERRQEDDRPPSADRCSRKSGAADDGDKTVTVLVSSVKRGGSADIGGLSESDQILAINGEPVAGLSYECVLRLITETPSDLTLTVVPDGAPKTTHTSANNIEQVLLEELQEHPLSPGVVNRNLLPSSVPFRCASAATMSDQENRVRSLLGEMNSSRCASTAALTSPRADCGILRPSVRTQPPPLSANQTQQNAPLLRSAYSQDSVANGGTYPKKQPTDGSASTQHVDARVCATPPINYGIATSRSVLPSAEPADRHLAPAPADLNQRHSFHQGVDFFRNGYSNNSSAFGQPPWYLEENNTAPPMYVPSFFARHMQDGWMHSSLPKISENSLPTTDLNGAGSDFSDGFNGDPTDMSRFSKCPDRLQQISQSLGNNTDAALADDADARHILNFSYNDDLSCLTDDGTLSSTPPPAVRLREKLAASLSPTTTTASLDSANKRHGVVNGHWSPQQDVERQQTSVSRRRCVRQPSFVEAISRSSEQRALVASPMQLNSGVGGWGMLPASKDVGWPDAINFYAEPTLTGRLSPSMVRVSRTPSVAKKAFKTKAKRRWSTFYAHPRKSGDVEENKQRSKRVDLDNNNGIGSKSLDLEDLTPKQRQKRRQPPTTGKSRFGKVKMAAVQSSSASMFGRSTSSTTQPVNQRIQKLISFFSTSSPSQQSAAQPSSKPSVNGGDRAIAASSSPPLSARLKKRSSTPRGSDSQVPTVDRVRVAADSVLRRGRLLHREVPLGGGSTRLLHRYSSSTGTSGWQKVYAVLVAPSTLFLTLHDPVYGHKELELPGDSRQLDINASIVDIAYDQSSSGGGGGGGTGDSGPFVFRLTTQQHTEHLLKTEDSASMLKWIEQLQRTGGGAVGSSAGGTPTTATSSGRRYVATTASTSTAANTDPVDDHQHSMRTLIMDRRKAAQSIMTSPTSRKKSSASKPTGEQQSAAASTTTGGATYTSIVVIGGNNGDEPKVTVQHAQSAPVPDAAKLKTSALAKQKKAKKSSSCPGPPVPSSSAAAAMATDAAPGPSTGIGYKLEDYPTSSDQQYVPLIVELCIKVVEAHGLETVGIYRIPGNTAAVNALTASLNQGLDKVNFDDPRWKDVNVVSSLLKAFFRKIPEPLLTDKYYPYFIDANRIENHHQRLRRFRHLLRKLPKHNSETLKFLMEHLKLIVDHSTINKMDIRNLALMFGPSIVRPSGDSMTTMVIHMSDQCKIIETFLLYCDWLFSPDDNPPPEPTMNDSGAVGQQEALVNPSTQMIEQAREIDFDGDKPKGLMKNPFSNVRRGSKRNKKPTSTKSSNNEPEEKSSPDGLNKRRTQSDKPTTQTTSQSANYSIDSVFGTSGYSERDIDAEIASRTTKGHRSESADAVEDDAGSGDVDNASGTQSTGGLGTPVDGSPQRSEAMAAWAEMRRRREENIYSARRRFMTSGFGGSGTAASTSAATNESGISTMPDDGGEQETAAARDGLVRHTRHLNAIGATGPAADMFSPETRERIRRFQNQGLISQLKWVEQRQNQQLSQVQTERQRVEKAYLKAKCDVDSEDYLDQWAAETGIDNLSTTSDYSTTSSRGGGGGGGVAVASGLHMRPPYAMTVSCNGALPNCSDYSSAGASPSNRQPIGTDGAKNPVAATAHTASVATTMAAGRSDGRSTDSPSTSSASGRTSRSSVVTTSVTTTAKRDKPWYELADDVADSPVVVFTPDDESTSNGSPVLSPVIEEHAHQPAASDTRRDSSDVAFSPRTLTPDEKPMARVSQKIRFRAGGGRESSSAKKRRDPRRHTISDLDQMKLDMDVLKQNGSPASSTEEAAAADNGGNEKRPLDERNGSAARFERRGSKKAAKSLKSWLKQSFRKSSPELTAVADST